MAENSGDSGAGFTNGKPSLQPLTNERFLQKMPTYPNPDASLIENSRIDPVTFPSSEDFGDPSMHEVLQWHMSECIWCTVNANEPPPAFGLRDSRHCSEYYEIVQEYSDYERDYAAKGNP